MPPHLTTRLPHINFAASKGGAIGRVAFLVAVFLNVVCTADDLFHDQIAPLLARNCLGCHNDQRREGGFSMESRETFFRGGDSGEVINRDDVADSLLLEMVRGPDAEMPQGGRPLSSDQVQTLAAWLERGAPWPQDFRLHAAESAPRDWWSLRPLRQPDVPDVSDLWPESLNSVDQPNVPSPRHSPESPSSRVRTPIDAFILKRLFEEGLRPSPEADRRTLIRRLSFDLLGLPPTPEEVATFIDDPDPQAYEKLVDRMLASPAYGERWGRHWLDVVHYADTHGYDKDKTRPHAWHYRDYVIRSFNDDKPYSQFVREQLAGDVLYPDSPDGVIALGFIAAGPFDWVGQIEVANGTQEKDRVRNLDRDDMVTTTLSTFTSATVHCARCHDHKFDPFTQEDYYRLQAVFSAVDRAERWIDRTAETAKTRRQLQRDRAQLVQKRQSMLALAERRAGDQLKTLDLQIRRREQVSTPRRPAQHGYHSEIADRPDVEKWVQVDLGSVRGIESIVLVGCYDSFNDIGAGFGFPRRFKVEVASREDFQDANVVAEFVNADVPNPGVQPFEIQAQNTRGRYVRVTATRLAPRKDDYIFALAELMVLDADARNLAAKRTVRALDSIEAPIRWQRSNLVDEKFPVPAGHESGPSIAELRAQRTRLLLDALDEAERRQWFEWERQLESIAAQIDQLPDPIPVFTAATEFAAQGQFQPTHGRRRPVYLLQRGEVARRGEEMLPGVPAVLADIAGTFPAEDEAGCRAALAEWIVHPDNPLTWRSIVNRVWHYHFGRGIVDSPNDFGHMGDRPTHPELLDWLATDFRDHGQSFKRLHRMIVLSATYRQTSDSRPAEAAIDRGNRWLWRMNRRRLEAEAIRDSVLAISGCLDRRMGGPGFQPFRFEDDHSPRYRYDQYDPDDASTHRRSVYRFVVRSAPDPLMSSLDCADPSISVPRRNETTTALQALAMLNNPFMIRMTEHLAERIRFETDDPQAQLDRLFQLALLRSPTDEEVRWLATFRRKHGWIAVCRLILNSNEFLFVD